MKWAMTAVGLMLVAGAVPGCLPWQRNKQLEQDNKELQARVQQMTKLLQDATARQEKQDKALKVCQTKIAELTSKKQELETQQVQMRKQLRFYQDQIAEHKAEAERQKGLALDYQTKSKSLEEQLAKARKAIADLKQQIRDILRKTAGPAQSRPGTESK